MSGLNGRPGKSVRSQGLREFESLLLRHLKGNMSIKIIPLVEALNGRHEKYCNTMDEEYEKAKDIALSYSAIKKWKNGRAAYGT